MNIPNLPEISDQTQNNISPQDFGLNYEKLESNDMCWVVCENGVIEGWVKNVYDHGNYRTYDINLSIGEMDELIFLEDVPDGVVFSTKLKSESDFKSRREKLMRLTRFYQAKFMWR